MAAVVSAAWRGGAHVERLMQAALTAEQLDARCPGMAVGGIVSPALARRVYAQLCGEPLQREAAADRAYTPAPGGWCDAAPRQERMLREVATTCPGVQRFTLQVGELLCERSEPCPEQPEHCGDEASEEREGCEPCSDSAEELYVVASMEVIKLEGGWGVILVDEAMDEAALTDALTRGYRAQDATPWCRLADYWEVDTAEE